MKVLVVGLLVLVTSCAPSPPVALTVTDAEVESWESVETTSMNAQIDDAVAAGEPWPGSPLLTTIELLGDDADTRILSIEETKNLAEGADTTVVVLMREGFLDDSVRGDWHRIVYRRRPDQTWRVQSVQRAFRCYRGHHLESFSRRRCP
jgi:hypothetical protein